MDKLSQEFLDSCRRDGGLIMRGENMTRIETFVDAAFAFAFTMLVISIDEIPRSPTELLAASGDIPAFIISATIIGAIWLAHANWSRTFGLQDRLTVTLSLALVMLVLIFVYPIKLMMQATVEFLSRGSLGVNLFVNEGWANNSVASLFAYFALGLIALSTIIMLLYRNSLRHRDELVLSGYEIHFCKQAILTWLVVAATAVVSLLVALVADEQATTLAGYLYFTLWFTIPLAEKLYKQ